MTAPPSAPGRIAFVPPRFGSNVVGGSESVTREVALGLAARGWEVEVLTTCAVDHYSWANTLEPGPAEEDGVVVRRFPTVHTPSWVGRRAQDLIEAEGFPTYDEQLTWIGFQFRAPELFHHLVGAGSGFDAVVFSPYLFWTTAVGLRAVVDRAVVMPCLHDEHYARLPLFREVLATPASLWFLSEPEHELAHRLGAVAPHHAVTGAGVHRPAGYDPDGFRARHGLARPFVLYAGRREPGKGWDWLLEAYTAAVEHHGIELDLVTVGVGEVEAPDAVADRVVDLGFVDASERDDAFAAASAYVQPSRMESFSRTIMESWLAGTPVLAFEGSAVVAWHCHRSGGGLTYADAAGLAECLGRIQSDPAAGDAMAEAGRRYVLEHYAWDVVLDRMERDLHAMIGRRVSGRQASG